MSAPSERPRIFVGDVQGCDDELGLLIAEAEARFGSDLEIWFVGDLVNRGPASLRVLERVHALESQGRARFVLGNHELSLLQCWFGLKNPGPRDTTSEILEAPDAGEWIDWLRTRPVAEFGTIDDHAFAMVHASVHPDWTLAELADRASRIAARLGHRDADVCQAFLSLVIAADRDVDADALGRLTRCRSVTEGGARWSSANPSAWQNGASSGATGGSVPWHEEWSSRGHDYGVIYGHWAVQRLHVAAGLRGLDTGCVHHGRGHDGFLTAWLGSVVARSEDTFAAPDDRFLQQKARARYYDFD